MAYLMPGAYSKPPQISKMMIHIEKSDRVRKVIWAFSGIFRVIYEYQVVIIHNEEHQDTFRHIQALLRHIEPYSDIFWTLCKPYIYNSGTLARLEPLPSSKACWSCMMIRNIQSPDQAFLRIGTFRDVAAYSVTLTGVPLRGMPPLPFLENRKKVSLFWNKRPSLCPSLG